MAKKSNQNLLIAAVVLVVAVAIFMNSGITGEVAKCNAEARVFVSPLEVPAGYYITIGVEPGPDGAKASAKVINSDDSVVGLTAPRHATRIYWDKQEWTYKTGGDWNTGVYRIRVDDKNDCSAYGYFKIV